jgi:two-component system chemotaxis response regulator CheB
LIGASVGSVRALTTIASALPRDLAAAVFVTMHVPPQSSGQLPRLLSQAGALPARHAQDREPIRHGHIYVAPPDHHLLVDESQVRLSRAPGERGYRPSVDTSFNSAALAHGPRCIGVVLSGPFSDGTSGLMTIKAYGGLAVVQDPAGASFPSMPRSALAYVAADHIESYEQIGPLLTRLVSEPIGLARRSSDRPGVEAFAATRDVGDDPASAAIRILH